MVTEKQVKALAFIIEEAKGNGWYVPTAKRVAEVIYPNRTVTRSNERAASALIKRLAGTCKAFVKKPKGKKSWVVNTRMFVTERPSASYILFLYKECHAPDNREKYVKKEDLHAAFRDQLDTAT